MAIYVEQFTTLIISNVWWVIVSMMLISSIVSYWLTQFRLRNKYEQHIQGISTQLTALQESNTEYQVANSALSASLQSLQESSKEKMVMMQQAEQQLSDRFERIANQIFDQKTKRCCRATTPIRILSNPRAPCRSWPRGWAKFLDRGRGPRQTLRPCAQRWHRHRPR